MAKKDQTEVAEDQTEVAASDLIAARVLRDYWPTEDQLDRVRKGAIVEVTAGDLINGMENGTLERIKD